MVSYLQQTSTYRMQPSDQMSAACAQPEVISAIGVEDGLYLLHGLRYLSLSLPSDQMSAAYAKAYHPAQLAMVRPGIQSTHSVPQCGTMRTMRHQGCTVVCGFGCSTVVCVYGVCGTWVWV